MPDSPSTHCEFAHRHACLSREFNLTHDRHQFGPYELEIWRPANPDAILDDQTLLETYEQMQWQPYWAQAWEASIGTCHYLATQSKTLQGKQVLDVGCGLGLTTALMLAAGARVVAGDQAPPALEFARLNCLPWEDRCEIQSIDWRITDLNRKFDLIVGSDILYDRREVDPLDRFFRRHLARQARVLLADPSRPMTREFLEQFARLGWQQSVESMPSPDTRLPTRIAKMWRAD